MNKIKPVFDVLNCLSPSLIILKNNEFIYKWFGYFYMKKVHETIINSEQFPNMMKDFFKENYKLN